MLSHSERQVLSMLKEDGALTARSIADRIGLGTNGRTVGPTLAKMSRGGLVFVAGLRDGDGGAVCKWAITSSGIEALSSFKESEVCSSGLT